MGAGLCKTNSDFRDGTQAGTGLGLDQVHPEHGVSGDANVPPRAPMVKQELKQMQMKHVPGRDLDQENLNPTIPSTEILKSSPDEEDSAAVSSSIINNLPDSSEIVSSSDSSQVTNTGGEHLPRIESNQAKTSPTNEPKKTTGTTVAIPSIDLNNETAALKPETSMSALRSSSHDESSIVNSQKEKVKKNCETVVEESVINSSPSKWDDWDVLTGLL